MSELAERLPLVCRTFYRESDRVRPRNGPVLVLDSQHRQATAAFPRLVLVVRHAADGYEARALHASVETPEGKLLFNILYQLEYDADPPNFFFSHGFTGLVYASDPETDAELQFFIRAEADPRPSPSAGHDADAPEGRGPL